MAERGYSNHAEWLERLKVADYLSQREACDLSEGASSREASRVSNYELESLEVRYESNQGTAPRAEKKGIENKLSDLEMADRCLAMGEQDIKSKVSLLDDLLAICKILSEELRADLDALRDDPKLKHVSVVLQQGQSKANKPKKSTAMDRHLLKRRAEEHETKNRSTKRIKVASRTSDNASFNSLIVSAIDTSPLALSSGITKTRDREATATSHNGTGTTAAHSAIPGKPEASLPDGEQKSPSFEFRAYGPRLEMLTNLCNLSQHMSEQQLLLTNYLEELTAQCKELGEDRQATAENYCQYVKTLADSIQNFNRKFRDAIVAF